MASVKKFDHGKITMDLPYFNYLYELPLYSFRDTIGSLSVSLIFNYSLSEEGSTIIFRPGYKLNLQKKLFIDNNEPYAYEDGFGKTRMLVTCDDISLYLFDDETQRFVYKDGSTYILEYPDYSKDVFDLSGKILSSIDKYNHTVLTSATTQMVN